MCFKSIYKKLKNDFSFLNNYGFEFEREVKHYVQPAIIFKKQDIQILIGFAYDKHRFFVSCFDEKSYERLGIVCIGKGELLGEFVKPIYVIGDKTILPGSTYKEQLDFVIEKVLTFLQTH